MRDCYAKRGGFAGWGDERRDRFLLTLVEIIRRHVLASVFSLVRPDEYKEWVASHGTPKGLASPYFVLYYAVISAVLRSMRSFNMDEKVEFVFDEQFNLSDRVQAYYTEAVRLMEPTLVSRLAGRPIHKSDENTPELQAADLFAWHVRRCHHESALGGKFETPSVVLLKKIPFWGMPLTKEALLAISDFAAEEQFKLALKQEIREITRKVLAEALADFDLANEGEPSQPS
jgi:hypothetical protein